MNNKMTLGPWTCHSGAVYQDGPNVWPKGDESGSRIALMDRENPLTMPTERDANAKAIAALPELIEALQNAQNSLRTFRNVPKDEQEWTPTDDDVMEAIESALRKAGV